jgi:hypothetical protein
MDGWMDGLIEALCVPRRRANNTACVDRPGAPFDRSINRPTFPSQNTGIPGVMDSAESATRVLEAALFDPRVHKHVDVTSDGLRRFFEALGV